MFLFVESCWRFLICFCKGSLHRLTLSKKVTVRICITAGGGNAPNSHCCFVWCPLFCKCTQTPFPPPPTTTTTTLKDPCNAEFNTNTSGIGPHHSSCTWPFLHWIKKVQLVQQWCKVLRSWGSPGFNLLLLISLIQAPHCNSVWMSPSTSLDSYGTFFH